MGNLIDTTGLDQYTDEITTFTSGDSSSPSSFTTIDVVASKEKPSSLFQKLSQAIANIRWLYKPPFTRNSQSTTYLYYSSALNPSSGSTISSILGSVSNMAQNVSSLADRAVKNYAVSYGGVSMKTESSANWIDIGIPPFYSNMNGAHMSVCLIGSINVSGLASGNNFILGMRVRTGASGNGRLIIDNASNGAISFTCPVFYADSLSCDGTTTYKHIYYKIFGEGSWSSSISVAFNSIVFVGGGMGSY